MKNAIVMQEKWYYKNFTFVVHNMKDEYWYLVMFQLISANFTIIKIQNDATIDKILISNKVSFDKVGYKYLNGYQDNEKVIQLHIALPKIILYAKNRWS